MYFDPTYMVLVLLPTMIISGLAQFFIRSTYNKWGNTANSNNLDGMETARHLKRLRISTSLLRQFNKN